MSLASAPSRLRSRPDRVFVSVDESTGKSTLSFFPADAGSPVQRDDDRKGEAAMKEARSIAEKYPGCTIHGPHFHAARPVGKWPRRRPGRPPANPGAGAEDSAGSPDSDD